MKKTYKIDGELIKVVSYDFTSILFFFFSFIWLPTFYCNGLNHPNICHQIYKTEGELIKVVSYDIYIELRKKKEYKGGFIYPIDGATSAKYRPKETNLQNIKIHN